MSPRHNSQIAQALYRVFVCPASFPIPRHASSTHMCTPIPKTQRRAYAKTRPPVERSHLLDEQIESRIIRVVDEHGKLSEPQRLSSALRSLDRREHFLVQMSAPSESTTDPPICKVTLKKDFYAAEHARHKVAKTPTERGKQLELNWAMGGNDLGHRLKKLVEVLKQGRRVEVILDNKKKGRRATEEEARKVLKEIRATVEKVEGVKEWTDMEGEVLGQCILHFEGKRAQ